MVFHRSNFDIADQWRRGLGGSSTELPIRTMNGRRWRLLLAKRAVG